MAHATLKFQVFETNLGNQTRFLARVPNPHNFDQAAVVDRMMDLGTSVSRGEVESVLALFQQAVIRICSEGSTASLDSFVRFAPAVGGTFDSDLDGFRPGRNTVYVNATVSSIFNREFAVVTRVEKTSANFKRPKLSLVLDFATSSSNQKVTMNNIVTLNGESLKFDLNNPNEYLRFVNDSDPNQFVAITKFQKRTNKELVFLMPTTSFSTGYFEVANAMNTTRIRSERSKNVEVAV